MRAPLIRSPYIEKILDGKEEFGNPGIANQCPRTHRPDSQPFWRSVCDVVDCLGPLTAELFRNSKSEDDTKRSKPWILPQDFRMGSLESSISESAGILQAPQAERSAGSSYRAETERGVRR